MRPAGLRRTHWAAMEEAGALAGLWFLYWLDRLFGRALFRAVMVPVVAYFMLRRTLARQASLEYLARVGRLPPGLPRRARWRRVATHFSVFADTLLDKALAWSGALDLDAVRVEVDPEALALLRGSGDGAHGSDRPADAPGRGGVMVVAHVGNLEVLHALGRRLPGLRLHVLVHTRHAQRFNRLLKRLNPDSAASLLQVTDLDAAMAARLSAAVDQGDWVVIAADRVPVSAAPRVVWAPFLGRPAPFPAGPWVLAASLRCPVLWLQCLRERTGYVLRCELFARRVELPRAQRAAALQATVARFAARLERCCREAPYGWFNFYPFWADPAAQEPATHAHATRSDRDDAAA